MTEPLSGHEKASEASPPLAADRALPGAEESVRPRPQPVPAGAVTAALLADAGYARKPPRPAVWQAVSSERARVMLEAAAPLIGAAVAAAERERIAARMDELAAYYPESVWPPDSDVRDSIGATAMRHAYRNAAREIREGDRD